ncbi:ribonuclease BN [Clostridium sporogenes]|uniref:ribonuclease BN n=1 Tax=Clostridium sporogenes TaxID=1509 RepID=UPI00313E7ABA
MKSSVFRTMKLLILGNIFLIPFSISMRSIFIRLLLGLTIGSSLIIMLSFTYKLEKLYGEDNFK